MTHHILVVIELHVELLPSNNREHAFEATFSTETEVKERRQKRKFRTTFPEEAYTQPTLGTIW